jgi:AcrR family transcriptional regulator
MNEGVVEPHLYDTSLPRVLHSGRHNVPAEVVAASQRIRLYEAVMEVVAEKGYAGATVALIAERAGVSSRTLYQHFANKDECFVGSYRAHAEMLLEAVNGGAAGSSGWAETLHKGLAAFLQVYVDHPAWSYVYAYGVLSANEVVLKQRYEGDDLFVPGYRALHAAMQAEDPTVPDLAEETIRACIGVVTELIRYKVRTDGPASVGDLLPVLFGVITLILGCPIPPDRVDAEAIVAMRAAWAQRDK